MKKLVLLFTLLCSQNAMAEKYFQIIGIGTKTCSDYLNAPTGSELDYMYVSWAQGAMSITAHTRQVQVSEEYVKVDNFRKILNAQCRSNRNGLFAEMVIGTVVGLIEVGSVDVYEKL